MIFLYNNMHNKKFGFRKGQTLMEILIYVAIFGTVAASLVGIVWNVTKIHSYQLASNEVDSNLRYAMSLINDKIRGASSVESAADSTLVLKMPNNTTTTFSVVSGILYIQEGSADPVAVISDRATVSSLTFEKIDMAGAKGGARITMTLNYVPKEGDSPSLQKTLISAITRSATAITFSEDIVPGQDNSYSVGSASYGWKNGYFSGDLTVDGTISGTTFCISSDCKTAWPSGGGGSVTGTGTTNKVAKWTGSTAIGDSIIYDDGTKVGIGASPSRLLDVSGSDLDSVYAFRVTSYDESLAEFVGKNDLRGTVSIRGGGGGDYARLDMVQRDNTNGVAGGIIVGHGVGGGGPTTDGFNLYSAKTGSGTTGPITFNFDRGDGALVEKARITSSGNVGIGVVSPGAALEVYDDADELLRLSRATASYPTKFKVGTDSALIINSGDSDVLTLKSGNVGIGTTSPQAGMRMDVRSDANTDGSSAITAYGYNGNGGMAIRGFGYATTGTGNNTGITGVSTGSRASGTNIGGYFAASGAASNYALVTSGGNVGIGTTSPTQELDVNGDIQISSSSGCLYLPNGGKLCGGTGTTCTTLYSPNGSTLIEACN